MHESDEPPEPPPYRAKSPSVEEFLEVLAGNKRRDVQHSDWVRQIFREEIERSKRDEDAETLRALKRNSVKISLQVLAAVLALVATFFTGHVVLSHFEHASSSSAPAPTH